MTVDQIIKISDLNDEDKKFFTDYLKDGFTLLDTPNLDTDFISSWEQTIVFAESFGVQEALNRNLTAKHPVNFLEPDGVKIEVYKSFSGKIPIIYIRNTADFEQFITNLLYKGVRPESLSSTGASFVFGKTARFIVLSYKPYSNVEADVIGLTESEWAEKSMLIRREHECTHYFTKQYYGVSRKHIQDELIADFFGIYEAFGYYKSEYFLRFMGIEKGGTRLNFYTDYMSKPLYKAVSLVARTVSSYYEALSAKPEFTALSRPERVKKLCGINLYDICEKS